MAASARRPGGVASRRGAGDKGPGRPLTPYDPQPRLGTASPDEHPASDRLTPSFLPAARHKASPSRCPALTRDERPGGVGASAPSARRSPPRHDALTTANRMMEYTCAGGRRSDKELGQKAAPFRVVAMAYGQRVRSGKTVFFRVVLVGRCYAAASRYIFSKIKRSNFPVFYHTAGGPSVWERSMRASDLSSSRTKFFAGWMGGTGGRKGAFLQKSPLPSPRLKTIPRHTPGRDRSRRGRPSTSGSSSGSRAPRSMQSWRKASS